MQRPWPLEESFGEYVAMLTGKRYVGAVMEQCIPGCLSRYDDVPVRFELLSKGNVDLVSLALRLAMAKFYLNDAGGVLMMDDPLVNLDPEQQ